MRRVLSLVTIAALGVVGVFACSDDRSVADVLSPGSARLTHLTLDNVKSALGNSATGAANAIVGVSYFGNDFQTAVHGVATQGFPVAGPNYLVISSGDARSIGQDAQYPADCNPDFAFGTNCDVGGFSVDLAIPNGASALAVSWKYFSTDAAPHRDPFQILRTSPGGTMVLEQVEICNQLGSSPGSGLRYGPMRTTVIGVAAFQNQTIRLRFEVRDHQDKTLATGALIDNLTFVTSTPTAITPTCSSPPSCPPEGCAPPPCGGAGQPACPPPSCGGAGQPTCPPTACTVNCQIVKQSQTNVNFFLDLGVPLVIGPGLFPPMAPPQGVTPGTNLIARVHVSALPVPGGEGISGPFTGRLLRPDGTIALEWNRTSSLQGIIDVNFQAGTQPGTYKMIADFAGTSRIGPDGITTQYTASSGEGTFVVAVPNTPPVANAGPDQEVLRTSREGATVTLDGSASTDAEGPLSYAWFKMFGPGIPEQPLGTGVTLQVLLARGHHNVRLQVTDAGGIPRSDVVSILVNNVRPVAAAGDDQILECRVGGVVAALSGTGSDVDGTIIEYKWFGLGNPAGVIGQNVSTSPRPLGSYQFGLEVTDNDAATSLHDQVRVDVVDTQDPVIGVQILATELWPPNHKMVLVASGASASDGCDPSPTLRITVTSNEPVSGLDADDLSPDWNVVLRPDGKYDVFVRAERGTDRIYTITGTATDRSGNSFTDAFTVAVPHRRPRAR